MDNLMLKQLKSDIALAERAVLIFLKSVIKAKHLLEEAKTRTLSDDDRETFEALTSRYGRALDFLTQKLLRTIDRIELTDDGSVLDRINRFKKRHVLRDEVNYASLKDLRNQIVHEYIIEESDRVVAEVLKFAVLIEDMLLQAKKYCRQKNFI